MKAIIWVLAALASGHAVAGSACDKPKNDFDGLYCLSKIYQEADKELNDNYRQLYKMLDAQGRDTLKRGQTEWMRERNVECSEYDAKGFLVNMRCATDTTIERGRYVLDRLRECKSSGCLNSKL